EVLDRIESPLLRRRRHERPPTRFEHLYVELLLRPEMPVDDRCGDARGGRDPIDRSAEVAPLGEDATGGVEDHAAPRLGAQAAGFVDLGWTPSHRLLQLWLWPADKLTIPNLAQTPEGLK